ncbi:aerolysin family beta-barrel pore-forming toxin [Zooshikella marina]|uniref:aerolysin family beta-barrel pore-forming toxin n=1 Tax=Zooshikella ganghwensis TaxID=202772 RepID=UPI001BB09D89|nr:aerolysin family beta-barrel pore-forming toxin [Zooshikella ganghwensis]MBU2706161.1 aerolysin family beta-barrel pore-forming toxin [Zooshikella ganghwensis]
MQTPYKTNSVPLVFLVSAAIASSAVYGTVKDDIPSYQDKLYAMQDSESLKWSILNDSEFHKPLAYLADYLGYGWCGGTASQYVGEDMEVEYNSSNSYSINARYNRNDPYASGYWADRRLKMNISDIKFITLPSTLVLGAPQVYDRQPLRTYVAVIRNFGSTTDTAVADLKYDQKTSWSKQDNYSFTEKIGIEKEFKAGLPILGANVKINAEFSATQGWNETNGKEQTTTQVAQYRASLPPKSKRTIYLTLFEQKADIPYTSKMYMNYNIQFSNFLRWSGNAKANHPDNRPQFDYTFGNRRNLSGPEDILDQYLHHDIKGYGPWDWPWMMNKYGKNSVSWVLGQVTKKRYGSTLSGKFMTVDGSQYNIDAGPDEPLTAEEIAEFERQNGSSTSRRAKRSLSSNSKLTLEIVEVQTHDNSDTVGNVSLTLSPSQSM